MRSLAARVGRGLAGLAVAAALIGCPGDDPGTIAPEDPPAGVWRAVLQTPGGELPFTLELFRDAEGLAAVARTAEESVRFTSVLRVEDRIVLGVAGRETAIEAELTADGEKMRGRWTGAAAEGAAALPFVAYLDDARRFLPLTDVEIAPVAEPAPSVAGSWKVVLADGAGGTDGRGGQETSVRLAGRSSRVVGTWVDPAGEARPVEGTLESGVLRLSAFDGDSALLLQARATREGSLEGDLWRGDGTHAVWTAQQIQVHAAVQ